MLQLCQNFIHYVIIYDVYDADDFIYKQTRWWKNIFIVARRKTTLTKALRIMTQILKCFKNYARTVLLLFAKINVRKFFQNYRFAKINVHEIFENFSCPENYCKNENNNTLFSFFYVKFHFPLPFCYFSRKLMFVKFLKSLNSRK